MRGHKYNVWITPRNKKKRRTSIHLPKLLTILLSLKLGHTPATDDDEIDDEAQRAVGQWLQQQIEKHINPDEWWISQRLQEYAIEYLIEGQLKNKYDRWWDVKLKNSGREGGKSGKRPRAKRASGK